ncbi:type VI secretion system Vgr family protein [Pseudomonas huanghezhanensis]|uniref:type VI secretion system Vgr family protein n=1 Tax=Pseudomonas huanghezhanensis TaxID=3002903 RepID=UPI0022865D76|nr:type VI secretion system Vgr family protein [Pseudomonas sp. BSw22131]
MFKSPLNLSVEQQRRLIKLTTVTQNGSALLLESFSGTEAISSLFAYELVLLSDDAHIELKSMIGTAAQLRLDLAPGARFINGFISRFSLESSDGGHARYTATLSPWLWMLSQRQDARIFQERTVEDIVRAVFAAYGTQVDVEFRLFQPLKPRSYVTQYFESDLDFVMRLLEDEGLLFFFEHSAQRHTLVIMDRSSELTPLPEQPVIRFHSASVTETDDAITRWSAHRQLQSGQMEVQTNDYKQPGNTLAVRMKSLNDQGNVEAHPIYLRTPPCSHRTHDDGEKLLRARIEAHEREGKGFSGASHCRAMCPGFTFELTQHFEHDLDSLADRQFLLLTVEHRGRNNYLSAEPATYENTFTCIRRKIPYKPTLKTPRPTMSGPLTAVVIGPENEEVFTDELGRIRVRFHWQRRTETSTDPGAIDTHDTAWLRVAMPSAGERFGHQFLPRIGQEVLVQHMAGDVDRPLVTGVVYNAVQAPPYFSGEPGLPGNKTLSGIKSREHKGAGYNELLFDDTPGALRARVASTHRATALNLGALTTPRNKGRAQPRGDGAELRTDAAIALRAAQGMLLTTFARTDAKGAQLDREELLELLAQCGELFTSLGQTAAAQGSHRVDQQGVDGLSLSLEQWPAPDSPHGGDPVIAVAASAGIVSATPRSQLHVAGENHDLLAHQHIQLTSAGASRINAGKGIALFAEDLGVSAIANRGKVLIQAQNDDVALNAQQNVQVSATQGEVVISAPRLRFIAEDGSYIKIGAGIEIGTRDKVIVHGREHDWLGPNSEPYHVAMRPPAEPVCLECLLNAAMKGAARVTL